MTHSTLLIMRCGANHAPKTMPVGVVHVKNIAPKPVTL